MEKESKRRIIKLLFGIFMILVLCAGVSFAVFTANLTGKENQSINTGCLEVKMTDNGSISLANQAPTTDEEGLLSKPYTYTIENTCSVDSYYVATYNIMTSSNIDNLSKIKISLSKDSYLAPSFISKLEEMESVDTSETGVIKTYKLDDGYLEAGDSKTFEVRTWIDYDVEEITGGLESKVIVLNEASSGQTLIYKTNTSGYQVLKNRTNINNADFSSISPSSNQVSGIVKVEDRYYYRGNPDNYLSFAGKMFRVLSTNNDGSTNIVLNEAIGSVAYDNKQSVLNDFYSEIESEETYIKTDSTFCEETIDSNSKIKVENNNPKGTCTGNNYMEKIGLLTADDLMFAGAVKGKSNTEFYLSDENSYYTSSFESENNIYSYDKTNSIKETDKETELAIKPVITLKSDVMILGEGTETEPFYVSGLYSEKENVEIVDNTEPIITYARVDEKWSNQNKNIEIAVKEESTGSDIAGYMVTESSTKPSKDETGWEASSKVSYTTVNSYDNGTYYVYAKDKAGNVSEGYKVVIEKVDKENPTCYIEINPNGTETKYKTLSIKSDDTNIDKEGYSWEGMTSTLEVIKVKENGTYTANIKDLAGNTGSCSATVLNITEDEQSASDALVAKVGTGGLEEITHAADDTLQIGATEDITEYRYRGSSPNNYVYFNCTDINNQTSETCELYRIIGVFPVDDGTGNIENRVKLIKSENYGNNYWDTSGVNNWARPARLNTTFNTTYWAAINADYQTLVGDAKYYLGGYTSTSIGTSVMYGYERKTSGTAYYYSGNPTNWTGKIGLMYASDYGYAANSACSESINLYDYYNSTCTSNNWLYLGSIEWLLPQYSSNTSNAFNVNSGGNVSYSTYVNGGSYAVRPTFYLTPETQIVDGEGTSGNPYQLG